MKKITLLASLVLILAYACKKNQLDGKSTIKGTVSHHSKVIPNATVFIKFKAKDSPGEDTTAYDAKVRADKDGNYSIKVYKGDYYLFGFGYDYAVPPPFQVIGGAPVHVRNNEEVKIDLAVSED